MWIFFWRRLALKIMAPISSVLVWNCYWRYQLSLLVAFYSGTGAINFKRPVELLLSIV